MKIHLLAMGRAKNGPEKALFDHYSQRIRWTFQLHELEEKRSGPAGQLKQREAALLLAAIPRGATVIALDERGKSMGSVALASKLQHWQDEGQRECCFIIGGADGLEDPGL